MSKTHDCWYIYEIAKKQLNDMNNETKTVEETTILDIAVKEIERQKFSLIENKTPATKVGLTDALSVLKFLKDEHYIKCECGHEVEHKFSHTNEDGQVTCYTCVNADLKKQNAELMETLNRIKLIVNSKSFGLETMSWYIEQIKTHIAKHESTT